MLFGIRSIKWSVSLSLHSGEDPSLIWSFCSIGVVRINLVSHLIKHGGPLTDLLISPVDRSSPWFWDTDIIVYFKITYSFCLPGSRSYWHVCGFRRGTRLVLVSEVWTLLFVEWIYQIGSLIYLFVVVVFVPGVPRVWTSYLNTLYNGSYRWKIVVVFFYTFLVLSHWVYIPFFPPRFSVRYSLESIV